MSFAGLTGGVEGFLANGPVHHRRWAIFSGGHAADCGAARCRRLALRAVCSTASKDTSSTRRSSRGSGSTGIPPRTARPQRPGRFTGTTCLTVGGDVADALKAFRRDLNAVLSRGVRRVYQIALREYRDTLDSHGVLDFSETLAQALVAAGADGRVRAQPLPARRALSPRAARRVSGHEPRAVDARRAAHPILGRGQRRRRSAPLIPSIFLVGDRKQSIYGFRDADVAVMDEAGALRRRAACPIAIRAARFRRASARFRSCWRLRTTCSQDIEKDETRRDAFRFGEQDRFPVELPVPPGRRAGHRRRAERCRSRRCGGGRDSPPARLAARSCATPRRGEPRPITPRDIGILFRTKDSHQDFEKALERRHIPSYVYKGLGFFEADEIKDVLALLRYLAAPESNLRAAAFLRSRFVRLSDPALQALAPESRDVRCRAGAPISPRSIARIASCSSATRQSVARWLGLVDRLPPAELLELVLDETAYLFETRGAARAPGARKPEEDPRDDSPRAEPRLRDDVAAGRAPRAVDGRRRVERRHRRRRLGEPDDDSRGEGARVSGRLRRESQPGHRRRAAAPIRVVSDVRERRRRG